MALRSRLRSESYFARNVQSVPVQRLFGTFASLSAFYSAARTKCCTSPSSFIATEAQRSILRLIHDNVSLLQQDFFVETSGNATKLLLGEEGIGKSCALRAAIEALARLPAYRNVVPVYGEHVSTLESPSESKWARICAIRWLDELQPLQRSCEVEGVLESLNASRLTMKSLGTEFVHYLVDKHWFSAPPNLEVLNPTAAIDLLYFAQQRQQRGTGSDTGDVMSYRAFLNSLDIARKLLLWM